MADTQYYYDGLRSYKSSDNYYNSELKIPYNETPWYKASTKDYQALTDRRVAESLERGYCKNNLTEITAQNNNRDCQKLLEEMNNEAKKRTN